MAAHAREHRLKLSLSAVQICFELATDLLEPEAAVGNANPNPDTLALTP